MALFKKKEQEQKTSAESVQEAKQAPVQANPTLGISEVASVLLSPRITEKATFATDQHAYVFDVMPQATKKQIAEAVKKVYKVTPVKVNTIAIPYKRVDSAIRRRRGVRGGGKKAYVYLKKGERIELI